MAVPKIMLELATVSSSNLDSLPVQDGRIIVLSDKSGLFYDMRGARHKLTSIEFVGDLPEIGEIGTIYIRTNDNGGIYRYLGEAGGFEMVKIGGFALPPSDNKQYVQKNGLWQMLDYTYECTGANEDAANIVAAIETLNQLCPDGAVLSISGNCSSIIENGIYAMLLKDSSLTLDFKNAVWPASAKFNNASYMIANFVYEESKMNVANLTFTDIQDHLKDDSLVPITFGVNKLENCTFTVSDDRYKDFVIAGYTSHVVNCNLVNCGYIHILGESGINVIENNILENTSIRKGENRILFNSGMTNFERDISLESTSWADIINIANSGSGASFFHVGDTKTLQIGENTWTACLIGFNHDSNSAGQTKNMTFACYSTPALTKTIFDDNEPDFRTYIDSECTIRQYLSTLLSSMNDAELVTELTTADGPVKRTFTYDNSMLSTANTYDPLFLFSYVELSGKNLIDIGDSTLDEGSIYSFFDMKDDLPGLTGYSTSWIRSRKVTSQDDSMYAVGYNTGANTLITYRPDRSCGFMFGFCL